MWTLQFIRKLLGSDEPPSAQLAVPLHRSCPEWHGFAQSCNNAEQILRALDLLEVPLYRFPEVCFEDSQSVSGQLGAVLEFVRRGPPGTASISVFIIHASEDKEDVAPRFAEVLER